MTYQARLDSFSSFSVSLCDSIWFLPAILSQNDVEQSREERIAHPDERADNRHGDADDTRISDELFLARPRYLFHLGDDLM